MDRKWLFIAGPVLAAILVTSCGGSKKPIVVGSKDTTEQVLLGEIVAQHLEHRLGRKVGRSLSLGNTPVVYQAMSNGEVGIYPEETGTIQATILKEAPALDASSQLERVRNEMRRISQMEVLDPLGIDNSWAIVVHKDEAAKEKIETLSDAAKAKTGWKLGVTRDFNERNDGLTALNLYRLPMGAAPRVSDAGTLYGALGEGSLTMVVGNETDGQLDRHTEWTQLRDDKKVFGFYQTCLVVRMDLLANDPKIRPALQELSGKLTKEGIRKLDAEVGVDHKKPADVAAEFLQRAGLK
jgi:glycine betaine/choline ABC-type transport system substrate-binding protein